MNGRARDTRTAMQRDVRHGLLGAGIVFGTIVGLLQLTAVPMAGQDASTTAWQHPTLEGIWLDVYATPFERAPELGDREFATAEKRAALDQAPMGNAGRDRRGPAGSPQDVSGAYNAVYTSVKPPGPRTSLVVDPTWNEPSRTPEWATSGLDTRRTGPDDNERPHSGQSAPSTATGMMTTYSVSVSGAVSRLAPMRTLADGR